MLVFYLQFFNLLSVLANLPFLCGMQINDRYEFPLQLDLDRDDGKYLSPDADRSVRNLYTLHRSVDFLIIVLCSFSCFWRCHISWMNSQKWRWQIWIHWPCHFACGTLLITWSYLHHSDVYWLHHSDGYWLNREGRRYFILVQLMTVNFLQCSCP
jgi:hypothetical protein